MKKTIIALATIAMTVLMFAPAAIAQGDYTPPALQPMPGSTSRTTRTPRSTVQTYQPAEER